MSKDNGNFAVASPRVIEMEKTLEALKLENSVLKDTVNYLRKENFVYTRRYYELKRRLKDVNAVLAKNAQCFHDLFDDTNNALQIVITSPLSKRTKVPDVVNLWPNSEPGPSGVIGTARKIHIEPINIRELEESMVVEEEEEEHILDIGNGNLSTIIEEDTLANESTKVEKQLLVELSRLPNHILQEHLRGKSARLEESLHNTTPVSPHGRPTFSSTPLKLEAMEKLGLTPVSSKNAASSANFITTRKRRNVNVKVEVASPVEREESVSIVQDQRERHEFVTDRNKVRNEPRVKAKISKRPKARASEVSAPSTSTRPARKAKPSQLKELSLKKKMRHE